MFNLDENDFWTDFEEIIFPESFILKAEEEVKKIIKLLKLSGEEYILDFPCGVGRHSIEFAKKNYKIKGVDKTQKYLSKAIERAEEEKLDIDFEKEDLRNFCQENTFDLVLNLYTSIGYFDDINDDKKVISNIYKSLKKDGRLLLELMGKEVLAGTFKDKDFHRLKYGVFFEEREILKDWEVIKNRYTYVKDNKVFSYEFCHRIYSAFELKTILKEAGFKDVIIYGGLEGEPYNNKAKRLVVLAIK